jgi:hypothetical protein
MCTPCYESTNDVYYGESDDENLYYDERDDEYEYYFDFNSIENTPINLNEIPDNIISNNETTVDDVYVNETTEEALASTNEEDCASTEALASTNTSTVNDVPTNAVSVNETSSNKTTSTFTEYSFGPVVTCSICIDDIEGSSNKMTTDCGHCFHTKCFLQHVAHNGFTCPLCRNQIIDEPEDEDSDFDEYEDDEDDDEDEFDDVYEPDANGEDFALQSLRWLYNRVEEDNDEDEDDEDYSDDIQRMEYERGNDYFGESELENISLSTVRDQMIQRGITYNDLVALAALPHKDNAADLAEYPHTRLMDLHAKIKDIIYGVPFVPVVVAQPVVVVNPVVEFEPSGKPLTLEDLSVDHNVLETLFEL